MTPPTVQFIPSAASGFVPTDILGCVGWFDASDSSTITLSPDVSAWDNKGTNASVTYTQATVIEQPKVTRTLNGLDVLTFDGVSDVLDGALPTGLSSVSLFIVADPRTDTQFNYFNIGGGGYSELAQSGSTSTGLRAYFGTPTNYVTGNIASWVTRNDVYVGLSAGPHVYEAINCNLSVWTSYTLGGYFKLGGDIAEVLIYDSSLASSDREKVEGYLAHKWGLAADLPASHPYKSMAP